MNKEMGQGGRSAWHGLGGRKAQRFLAKMRKRKLRKQSKMMEKKDRRGKEKR